MARNCNKKLIGARFFSKGLDSESIWKMKIFGEWEVEIDED
ncbi:uncharacterized protein G2W53_005457 [Senna tora]|uniref:Uncharacterized protein n=1 Tax=Senna tora TaxID=362788 RepID=A0A834X262_9FABA|nr:uncharacterized protein G2W53_005457 [Senna tora]